MRLNLALLNDIENNAEFLDLEKALFKFHKPYLIIHGNQDLAERANSPIQVRHVTLVRRRAASRV